MKILILIGIYLKFVAKGPIDNNTVLVWIIAWRRKGDKPLSEPMLTRYTDAYMRLYGDMSETVGRIVTFLNNMRSKTSGVSSSFLTIGNVGIWYIRCWCDYWSIASIPWYSWTAVEVGV